MKAKKLKKLVLNKNTISNLNELELNMAKGGTSTDYCITLGCYPTNACDTYIVTCAPTGVLCNTKIALCNTAAIACQ